MISRAGQGYEATSIHAAESDHRRMPVGGSRLVEAATFEANALRAKSIRRGDRYRVNTSTADPNSTVCVDMPVQA